MMKAAKGQAWLAKAVVPLAIVRLRALVPDGVLQKVKLVSKSGNWRCVFPGDPKVYFGAAACVDGLVKHVVRESGAAAIVPGAEP
jgi:hypothetical protein